MAPTETTSAVTLLHLVTTLALLLLGRYEKRLGSRAYVWLWRAITLLLFLCIVCSAVMIPRDMNALIRDYYAEPYPLCLNDLDFTLQLVHPLWSALLCLFFFTHPVRTRKLTLAASCRYVALRYGYSYERLMALCRKHRYAFFPIGELEQYEANIRQGDGGENEARAFVPGDLDHYLAEMDRQEEALLSNDTRYNEQVRVARETYEANRDPLVLARRHNATMTYEQYVAMKQQLNKY